MSFVIGLFIGFYAGVIVMACIAMAKQKTHTNAKEEENAN